MHQLPLIDIAIILLYMLAMILVGVYFSRKNTSAEGFTKASGQVAGWAVGISIYATFLSSNTFLGVPGKAFGENWNAFVFSLSMPLAAWIATKYFVPFYRQSGEISAYTHLEKRFGPWARTYTMACFLLTQLARIGSIFFGISLTLQALTGYSMVAIMVVTGICIIIYTVLGGMEAVIWTEVVQGILLTVGALAILILLIKGIGFKEVISIGNADHKFSLGSWKLDFKTSSFWVVLLYGFFINLNNFGMDQNYIQRYHTAKDEKAAGRSVWMSVWFYVPVSFLFFVIGSWLYGYYFHQPELLESIRLQAASEQLGLALSSPEVIELASRLSPNEYGDKVLPHFMVSQVPTGLLGLIISAILSAAMSTISSGMNASATVFSEDIYKRYFNKKSNDKSNLRVLHIATVIVGLLGLVAGIAMIGIKSILDVWWTLSGIFAGGMLGLFLLGFMSRKLSNSNAVTGTIVGILVILWMTFSYLLPDSLSYLKNPLHANMIIVVGTLTIYLAGNFSHLLKNKNE